MPIFNEEVNIALVLDEWSFQLRQIAGSFTIYAVNDGSTDGTRLALEKYQMNHPEFLTVLNKPNSGHGRSCRHGYDTAIAAGASWVLQIDSDGQCDPKYFTEFWNQTDKANCIFGLRTTRDDGFGRVVISAACRFLTMLWTGSYLRDANVPYRLMRGDVLANALKKIPPDFNIHNVALSLALKRDPLVRWAYVPIHFRDRQGGVNSINFRKIFKMGWEMLRDLKRIGV